MGGIEVGYATVRLPRFARKTRSLFTRQHFPARIGPASTPKDQPMNAA
jgi:hypothetical protein